MKPIPSFAPLTWRNLRVAGRPKTAFVKRPKRLTARHWSSKEVAMRVSPLLLIASALASCTMAPPPPGYAAGPGSAGAGRFPACARRQGSAGPPLSCLPPGPTYDMTANVEPNTIIFERGSDRSTSTILRAAARGSAIAAYALVTRASVAGPCRGDIAQVVDLSTHTFIGACSLGDFIPTGARADGLALRRARRAARHRRCR